MLNAKRLFSCFVFLLFAIWLLSWQSQTYAQYCEEADKCAEYNLLIYGWLIVTHFTHVFESFFLVLLTLAIALFTWQLRVATVGLDESTKKLWLAGEKQFGLVARQTDLVEKQHGLQREEYFASHRPRVKIRRMGAVPVLEQATTVHFTIVNVGEAVIKDCTWNGQILLLKKIGAIHTVIGFNPKHQSQHNEPLAVGSGIRSVLLDRVVFGIEDVLDIERREKFLHVIGYVAYIDILDVTRRIGFFRYYDANTHRFRVVDDPEYEYQD